MVDNLGFDDVARGRGPSGNTIFSLTPSYIYPPTPHNHQDSHSKQHLCNSTDE